MLYFETLSHLLRWFTLCLWSLSFHKFSSLTYYFASELYHKKRKNLKIHQQQNHCKSLINICFLIHTTNVFLNRWIYKSCEGNRVQINTWPVAFLIKMLRQIFPINETVALHYPKVHILFRFP